jgi:hypothetical protein
VRPFFHKTKGQTFRGKGEGEERRRQEEAGRGGGRGGCRRR